MADKIVNQLEIKGPKEDGAPEPLTREAWDLEHPIGDALKGLDKTATDAYYKLRGAEFRIAKKVRDELIAQYKEEAGGFEAAPAAAPVQLNVASYEDENIAMAEDDAKAVRMIMGVAVSHKAVTPSAVLAHYAAYIVSDEGRKRGRRTILLSFGLSAVGTIKDEWCKALNPHFKRLGPVGSSFRGTNGPNFRGFTVLGYIIMEGIGIAPRPRLNENWHVDMLAAFANFGRLVPGGMITGYVSQVGPTDRDKKRDTILSAARDMFNRDMGWRKHAVDLARVLNYGLGKMQAEVTTSTGEIGTYDESKKGK